MGSIFTVSWLLKFSTVTGCYTAHIGAHSHCWAGSHQLV